MAPGQGGPVVEPGRSPFDRPAGAADGLDEAVGVVELPGVVVEHLGQPGRREPVLVRRQRCGIERQRLTARAGPRALRAGPRRELGDCRAVAGLDGVVDKSREVDVVARPQQLGHLPLQPTALQLRQARLRGPPRELVPEAQPLLAHGDDADLLRLPQGVEIRSKEVAGDVEIQQAGPDRHPFHPASRPGREPAQPRQDGVGHTPRHRRVGRGGQGLGDVERVAAGDRVQLSTVPTASGAEQLDARGAERAELDRSVRPGKEPRNRCSGWSPVSSSSR